MLAEVSNDPRARRVEQQSEGLIRRPWECHGPVLGGMVAGTPGWCLFVVLGAWASSVRITGPVQSVYLPRRRLRSRLGDEEKCSLPGLRIYTADEGWFPWPLPRGSGKQTTP